MTLLRRVGFYLGGFSIGLVILAFFLSGKKTSCEYGPNARVLKNIRIKEKNYDPLVQQLIDNKTIDTLDIYNVLSSGDVDFDSSNTKLDSCKTYTINGVSNEKKLQLFVENCDSIANIKRIKVLQ